MQKTILLLFMIGICTPCIAKRWVEPQPFPANINASLKNLDAAIKAISSQSTFDSAMSILKENSESWHYVTDTQLNTLFSDKNLPYLANWLPNKLPKKPETPSYIIKLTEEQLLAGLLSPKCTALLISAISAHNHFEASKLLDSLIMGLIRNMDAPINELIEYGKTILKPLCAIELYTMMENPSFATDNVGNLLHAIVFSLSLREPFEERRIQDLKKFRTLLTALITYVIDVQGQKFNRNPLTWRNTHDQTPVEYAAFLYKPLNDSDLRLWAMIQVLTELADNDPAAIYDLTRALMQLSGVNL